MLSDYSDNLTGVYDYTVTNNGDIKETVTTILELLAEEVG
jgi:2-phosphoglycerate kinase